MRSRWLGIEEAAEMLGTGREGILTMIRFRELPVALDSVQALVWREAVEAKVRSSKQADSPTPPKRATSTRKADNPAKRSAEGRRRNSTQEETS
jgi:hypothetical protein